MTLGEIYLVIGLKKVKKLGPVHITFHGIIGNSYIYTYMCTWASLIAQLVKNPPAMQETLVQFLGQEDPLVKG